MEPLNVTREEFPMSTAAVPGMIPMEPELDNYEIFSFYLGHVQPFRCLW